MLKAIDIHKSYDNLKVLKGVGLEVKKGEIVSIVGVSGAGKSTLLHILGTLDDSDQGYVEINNVKIKSKPKFDLVPVNWKVRILGYLIDKVAIYFFTSLVFSLLYIFWFQPSNELNFKENIALFFSLISYVMAILFPLACAFVYYLIFESIFGRTIGKFLTGTKVIVKNEGLKPGFLKILGRTAVRFVPFEFITFFTTRPEGWHDSAANLIVIKDDFSYQKALEKSLNDKELSQFRNKHIGFIFQFHNLLPEFTALENVCIPAFLSEKNKDEVKNKAKELLELLGLADRVDHKPSELSGGEQQRVAIARALINDPVIIFADEPSGNLDSHNAEELHKLFFKLRDSLNQTFIIVTHNEKLANMADRKLEMRDGKII